MGDVEVVRLSGPGCFSRAEVATRLDRVLWLALGGRKGGDSAWSSVSWLSLHVDIDDDVGPIANATVKQQERRATKGRNRPRIRGAALVAFYNVGALSWHHKHGLTERKEKKDHDCVSKGKLNHQDG